MKITGGAIPYPGTRCVSGPRDKDRRATHHGKEANQIMAHRNFTTIEREHL
jgi:hypothetical protein